MKNWRFDGIYYVKPWGFSLNESRFPNVHLSYWKRFYFYFALSTRWRWSVGGL
jgi:hypothetical protein